MVKTPEQKHLLVTSQDIRSLKCWGFALFYFVFYPFKASRKKTVGYMQRTRNGEHGNEVTLEFLVKLLKLEV